MQSREKIQQMQTQRSGRKNFETYEGPSSHKKNNNQNTPFPANRFKTPPQKYVKASPHTTISLQNSGAARKKKVIKIENAQRRGLQLEESTRANTMVGYQWKLSDFEIVKQMGRGKFGYVYAAKQKLSDYLVALKKMWKQELRENKFESQVKREVIIQAGLSHENILKLYGYFWDEASVYLILEYAPGGELFNMLRKLRRFSEETVSVVIRQVCEGIQYLHEKSVIHRDIKPENILVSNEKIKIADFGWSVHAQGRRETLCGTLDYLAPEIVKGESHDSSIDIWQIGILAYELAVGTPPFETNSHEETYSRILHDPIFIPASMSQELKELLSLCLEKLSEKRPSIGELLSLPFVTKYSRSKLTFF